MKQFSIYVLVLVAGFILSSAAHAASGIGFAQAEEGTWYCRGDDAADTLNCAAKKCQAEAGGQDCERAQWCFNAGWSGFMTVFLPDFHTTKIICGAPGRQALRSAFKAFCEGNPYATSCAISVMIDPAGKEYEIEDAEFRGPAAK